VKLPAVRTIDGRLLVCSKRQRRSMRTKEQQWLSMKTVLTVDLTQDTRVTRLSIWRE